MSRIWLPASARTRTSDAAATDERGANAVRGCAGSGAGTPCFTTSGVPAGSAFAARTMPPKPAAGPYQAVFASRAKRKASKHRPKALGARRKEREAANDPDILAVYHAAVDRGLARVATFGRAWSAFLRCDRHAEKAGVNCLLRPRKTVREKLLHGADGDLNVDLRRRQQSVVNRAVPHRAQHSFRLLFGERDGGHNMNAEVAQPTRLQQLFRGH